MNRPRLALRLLTYADTAGVREELVGDVLEEMARGRSQVWVCEQLIGLYGLAAAARLRARARLTPHVVVLALVGLLVASASIAAIGTVLLTWLSLYLVTGTLSLFAHMAARAMGSEGTVVPAAEAPAAE
jgi:hypothetical protein